MNHSLTTNLPSIPQKLYNVQNSYQLSLQAYAVGVFFTNFCFWQCNGG